MLKVRQQRLALAVALYVLRKNGFPQPPKRQVLNFIRIRRLLKFPERELTVRSDRDHDEIWENDIAWKRKDLYESGEIDSPEFGHWRLTQLGVEKIQQHRVKWLKLESPDERKQVLAELEYWTEDLLSWMLKIAKGDDLSLAIRPIHSPEPERTSGRPEPIH